MITLSNPAELVLLAFTVSNALQVVSYIPQIVNVWRDRHGAEVIAYSTWAIWLAGSAATAAYALVNIWDVWLASVNSVHAVCCLAVIGLTAWKRAELGKTHSCGRPPCEAPSPRRS